MKRFGRNTKNKTTGNYRLGTFFVIVHERGSFNTESVILRKSIRRGQGRIWKSSERSGEGDFSVRPKRSISYYFIFDNPFFRLHDQHEKKRCQCLVRNYYDEIFKGAGGEPHVAAGRRRLSRFCRGRQFDRIAVPSFTGYVSIDSSWVIPAMFFSMYTVYD